MEVEAPFARCGECPLMDQCFVPGNGPTQTDLVVVGQAPGEQECKQRKPFVGSAGVALKGALASLGVDPSKVYFTNTALCYPGKIARKSRDKKPPRKAITACLERLKRETERTKAKWILAVGVVAAEGVTGKRVLVSESRCSRVHRPLAADRLGSDALVGITHHPSAPLPKALLVADIRELLSFRCNQRAPDVYPDVGT